MDMNLRVIPRETYLYALVTGIYSLPEAKKTAQDIFKACGEHGISKALVDFRTLQLSSSTLEDFKFAEFIASINHEHVVKGFPPVKMVGLAKAPMRPSDLFGETVALNRGFLLKYTDDFVEACNWLGIDPASAGSGLDIAAK